MRISGFIYRRIINSINILPKVIRNLIVRLLRFSKIPNTKYYTDLKYNGIIDIKVNDGISFKMHSFGATLENEIYWKGLDKSLEPETIWLWKELCKDISVVIDIGANTGLYSLLTRAINEHCKVIAFEPSVKTFNNLQQNIQLNNFDIIAENVAVSNIDGKSIFYDTKDGIQTSASLDIRMKNPDADNVLAYEISTVKLDSYVAKNHMPCIDLIKIDVELHEPEVTEGMKNILNAFRPFILIEVLLPDIAEKLTDYFKDCRYSFYHFIKVNNSYRLTKVDKLIDKINWDWNYFISPKEKEYIINRYTS